MPEKEEELQPLADSISITSSVLSSLVVRNSSKIFYFQIVENCYFTWERQDVAFLQQIDVKVGIVRLNLSSTILGMDLKESNLKIYLQ